jgi:hypothetical protein
MASEGTSTVPRMGSFKRALLGYRRDEVDAAIEARDAQILAAEGELSSLSRMVIEREREIRHLGERLRDADERHQRSIASLHAVSERLEEIQAQARGQATRIRMKALREAVAVDRRSRELAEAEAAAGNGTVAAAAVAGNGAEAATEPPLEQLFEGAIRLEVGPLGDFSQLVGFENVVGRLGASEISIERFSEGRATLSMRLDEPVDLLRELEENAPFDFAIRRTADDNLILDVDEDQGPEQRAA